VYELNYFINNVEFNGKNEVMFIPKMQKTEKNEVVDQDMTSKKSG